jgi:hypothetical protein
MPIEMVYGSRPGDNAIGKRVDSIVQQMEQEKARALEASIAAARINAQMSAQNAENKLRARAMDLDAQKAAAQMGLTAEIQGRQAFADEARLGLMARQQNINAWDSERQREFVAERDQNLWYQDQGKMLAEELNNRQAAASQANLTPEGQTLYRDWAAKYRAVQKSTAGQRADKVVPLHSQLISEFDALGLQRFQIKEPTIDEEWKNNAVRLDDGSWVVREKSRNGFSWRQMQPAKQQEQSKQPGAQLDLGSYMSDRKNYLKEWNEASSRLMDRRKNATEKDSEGNLVAKPYTAPTDDEIAQEMNSHLQRWQGAFQGGGQMPMVQGGPTSPMPVAPGGPTAPMPSMSSGTDTLSAGPSQGNMPPAQPGMPPAPPSPTANSSGSVRVTPEMRQQVIAASPELSKLSQIADPEIKAAVNVLSGVQAAVATGQMSPDDPTAQKAVMQAQMVIQERAAKIDADRQASKAISSIGKDKVEGSLKKVKNTADYDEVKSGQSYIDPNGIPRVKP